MIEIANACIAAMDSVVGSRRAPFLDRHTAIGTAAIDQAPGAGRNCRLPARRRRARGRP